MKQWLKYLEMNENSSKVSGIYCSLVSLLISNMSVDILTDTEQQTQQKIESIEQQHSKELSQIKHQDSSASALHNKIV